MVDVTTGRTLLALTGEEIMEARKVIIRHHQQTEITSEIIKKLASLRLRKDKEDILRCYGRLGTSALKSLAKYLILILQKPFLARLIINEYHQGAHPGVNHTMSLVRQTFWIPQLRSQVIKQVRACFKCQRLNNIPFKYPHQSDLPPKRVIHPE
ncbi:hypothetical protein V3C99_013817 [Haemonchus contortus]|uniref:Integrase_H2C2 domain-containing protein n=1 Tax=Haemonchus contortus TaxID=6289 RepID=A0A7I4YSE7_HAECO